MKQDDLWGWETYASGSRVASLNRDDDLGAGGIACRVALANYNDNGPTGSKVDHHSDELSQLSRAER